MGSDLEIGGRSTGEKRPIGIDAEGRVCSTFQIDPTDPHGAAVGVEHVEGVGVGRMAGDDGVKMVKVLSGGEKVRCMLSKLMISGANVLLMDEPTDHLDMESITALNNGMMKFGGVLIFSSRDHQVVQTTANRIMEIIGGSLIDKITTYDEYLDSDEMARKRFTFTVSEDQEIDD